MVDDKVVVVPLLEKELTHLEVDDIVVAYIKEWKDSAIDDIDLDNKLMFIRKADVLLALERVEKLKEFVTIQNGRGKLSRRCMLDYDKFKRIFKK